MIDFTRSEFILSGAFTASRGFVVDTDALNGVLMQNLQASYTQPVTRIYELDTSDQVPDMYLIGGRSQGSLGVGLVIGLAAIMGAFNAKYGDVCQAATNAVRLNVSNGHEVPLVARQIDCTAKSCVLAQIGMSVGAKDMVVNKNGQLVFGDLECNQGG